jgi:hypothetical protein
MTRRIIIMVTVPVTGVHGMILVGAEGVTIRVTPTTLTTSA